MFEQQFYFIIQWFKLTSSILELNLFEEYWEMLMAGTCTQGLGTTVTRQVYNLFQDL